MSGAVRITAPGVVVDLPAEALDDLAELVARRLGERPAAGPPAYTVASLAAAVGASPKVIRGAIARGELAAVKRGAQWVISTAAVQEWAAADPAPAAAGPRRRPRARSHAARRGPLRDALKRLDGAG